MAEATNTKMLSQLTQKNLEANQQTVAAAKANATANFINAKTNRDQTAVLKSGLAQGDAASKQRDSLNNLITDTNNQQLEVVKAQSSKQDSMLTALKRIKMSVGGIFNLNKKGSRTKGFSSYLKAEKKIQSEARLNKIKHAKEAEKPKAEKPDTEERRELSAVLKSIKDKLVSVVKNTEWNAENTAGLLKDALGTGFSIFGILAAALLVFDPKKYMQLLTTGLANLANFGQDLFSIFNPADGESSLGNLWKTFKEHWGKVLSMVVILFAYLTGPVLAAVATFKAAFMAIGSTLISLGKFLLANPALLALVAAVAAVGIGIMKFKEMWEELEGVVGGNVSFVDAIRFAIAKIMDGAKNIFNLILNGINGIIRWYNDSAISKLFGKMEEFDTTAPEQTNEEKLTAELKAKNAREEQAKLTPEQTAVGANEVTPEPQTIQQQQAQFLAPQNNVIDNSSNSSSAISITQPIESRTSAFNRYNTSLLPF